MGDESRSVGSVFAADACDPASASAAGACTGDDLGRTWTERYDLFLGNRSGWGAWEDGDLEGVRRSIVRMLPEALTALPAAIRPGVRDALEKSLIESERR